MLFFFLFFNANGNDIYTIVLSFDTIMIDDAPYLLFIYWLMKLLVRSRCATLDSDLFDAEFQTAKKKKIIRTHKSDKSYFLK